MPAATPAKTLPVPSVSVAIAPAVSSPPISSALTARVAGRGRGREPVGLGDIDGSTLAGRLAGVWRDAILPQAGSRTGEGANGPPGRYWCRLRRRPASRRRVDAPPV
jgi:hypothetical protein